MTLRNVLMFLALMVLPAAGLAPHSLAASNSVPHIIDYSGEVLVDGASFNGTGFFKFALVNGVGDITYWTNTSATAGVPDNGVQVPVNESVFSVTLGDTGLTNMDSLPAGVFEVNGLYLRVWFSVDNINYEQLAPDRRLASVPFAYKAEVGSVPIGAIIDWWRPDALTPVPEGYAACDGSVVSDPDSPLDGVALPDLRNRFVFGAASTAEIGQYGGGGHSHSVNPPSTGSTSVGSHVHSTSIDHDHGTFSSTTTGSHNHIWSRFEGAFGSPAESWHTYNSGGTSVQLIDWGNGLDNAGENWYPLAYSATGFTYRYHYTNFNGNHSHGINPPLYDVANVTSTSSGSHNHSTDIGAFTSSASTGYPPYAKLLKIMRIK